MDARARVVREARSWLGTPFRHKQGKKGLGVDCLQLIWRVGENARVLDREVTKNDIAEFWPFYGRRPEPDVMRQVLRKFFVEITEDQLGDGDFVWMHWDNFIPVHFGLVWHDKGRRILLHAMQDYTSKDRKNRRGAVVEHGLAAQWPGRVDSFWRYPEVARG